jgi:hypothetical protein
MRERMLWVGIGVLSLLLAAALGLATSRLTEAPVGLTAEPVSADEALAPSPTATPAATATPAPAERVRKPKPTATPAPTAVPTAAPSSGDDGSGEDNSGHGSDDSGGDDSGHGRSGDDD